MDLIKIKNKLPIELKLYIIKYIPVSKCIICKRNFIAFKEKRLCSDKCKTIYKLKVIQIKLCIGFIRTHDNCLELSRIFFIVCICCLYSLAKLIALLTLLFVHNFDVFIVTNYFIEE